MRLILMMGMIALLTACGSSKRNTAAVNRSVPNAVPFASGPISDACMQADRRNASRQLCGCIQAVANQQLNGREQSKAVVFFKDPHQAQVTRQSGASFWKTYKAYAASAERVCRPAA